MTDTTKTPFFQAVREIIGNIDAMIPEGQLEQNLGMVLVGGVAVHAHTGHRVSEDMEAMFARRVIVPPGIAARYTDDTGEQRLLGYDTNYAEDIALLHPDAFEDANYLITINRIDVYVLTPTDLAVTKVGRWNDQDRDDVRVMAKQGLLAPETVQQRVDEAFDYYIGNTTMIAYNRDDALEIIRECRLSETNSPEF